MLKSDHVAVEGSEVRFQFTGKRPASNGRSRCATGAWRGSFGPARNCLDRTCCNISTSIRTYASSGDVNAYLREITGADITAKDFRTWAGTMLMARYLTLAEPFASKGQAKRVMSAAVKKVAAALGNPRPSAASRTSAGHF